MINMEIKILIVDELLTMRKIIRGFLGNLGIVNISEAEDGSTALQMLSQDSFDLLISDWNMQNMSGLELLKVIRSDENLKGLSVLLITAEAKKENIIEAIKAGANNCIIKPFSEVILKRKLEEIFK
jgi:two-component system chemotaxis response regulator CheY